MSNNQFEVQQAIIITIDCNHYHPPVEHVNIRNYNFAQIFVEPAIRWGAQCQIDYLRSNNYFQD